MKTAAALVAITQGMAAAQWFNLPTPGIPRLPDGSPNLAAPAPKALDGKPDLSGIWRSEITENGVNYLPNIARDLRPEDVHPLAEAISKQRLENLQRDEPWARCLPSSVPLLETAGVTYRIVQTPGLVVMLFDESGNLPRLIFLDGRELPKDPNPTWMGYSVGRWEGDTLVVDSIGFNDKTWLDTSGHPHTESLHLTERFRRLDVGNLELRITVDDPKTFAKPFTIVKHPKLRADYDTLEYLCAENERDSRHLVGK